MGFKTKQEAEIAGQELLNKMKDKNWKLKVWENMGWNFCITNGPLRLSFNSNSQNPYHILMSSNSQSTVGGLAMWTPRKSSSLNPVSGLKKQVELARKVLNGLTEAVEAAESILAEELKA